MIFCISLRITILFLECKNHLGSINYKRRAIANGHVKKVEKFADIHCNRGNLCLISTWPENRCFIAHDKKPGYNVKLQTGIPRFFWRTEMRLPNG